MRRPNFRKVSRMHWVGSCSRNLPQSGTGRTFSLDRRTCWLILPTKLWQSTMRAGLRSLIRKNSDFSYHCAVSEDVFRAARRGSASSPSSISDLPTEPKPSLRFKPVHPTRPIYSVRIGPMYRAVGILESDEIVWYWIGSHADYDKLLT